MSRLPITHPRTSTALDDGAHTVKCSLHAPSPARVHTSQLGTLFGAMQEADLQGPEHRSRA